MPLWLVVEDRILNGYNNSSNVLTLSIKVVEDRILNGYNNSAFPICCCKSLLKTVF